MMNNGTIGTRHETVDAITAATATARSSAIARIVFVLHEPEISNDVVSPRHRRCVSTIV